MGSGYDFSQETYNATTAAAITTDLSSSQDMATANLGRPWRLPTRTEFQELYDNCTHVWTIMNDVRGFLFTSKMNGKSIFFRAAGNYDATELHGLGDRGYYWSSSYLSSIYAYNFNFNYSDVRPQNHDFSRRFGFAVRAVLNL